MVSLLVRHMDANSVDLHGLTALFITQSLEMVELLISAGIDVNLQNQDGMNAFLYHCWRIPSQETPQILSLLKENGVDIDVVDSRRCTALYLAVTTNNEPAVKWLVENDCVPNVNRVCGLAIPRDMEFGGEYCGEHYTVFMKACEMWEAGDDEIIKLLLSIPGIDLETKNFRGHDYTIFTFANEGLVDLIFECHVELGLVSP